MKRPLLTKQEALEVMKARGWREPGYPVFVLAIRGYYKETMGKPGANDRGIWDDAMFVFGPNYFQAFNANTDPSRYRPGIAKLCPGLHFFKRDKHNKWKPKKAYDAFRPATHDESLPVTRDGKEGVDKGIAINIHKGSITSTSSAGCQTVFPTQWEEFQKTIYKMMDAEAQRELPYLLIEN